MFRSAAFVEEFYERASAASRQLTHDFEIIFVDDGSPDDSLAIAQRLAEAHDEVSVLELSRNFGHHKAMMTGLMYSTGDLVYLTDSDLEEPLELMSAFHETMRTSGADVVYGVQEQRKGGWFEKLSGAVFWRLINALSTEQIPRNLITARLMTRAYVDSLIQHRDREVFMAGLWMTTGFRQVPIIVAKGHKGSSSYDLGRKIGVAINSITSFSDKPLLGIFHLGIGIFFVSGAIALYSIGKWIVLGELLPGWLSLIVSVWILGGLTLASLGIIGIYLAKVFSEVKDRPYTVVRSVRGSAADRADGGE
jgi:putative glycosyltransferase